MGAAAAGLRPLLRQAALRPAPRTRTPPRCAATCRPDLGYQRGLVRFLENHDEPRAAARVAPAPRERAAAVTVATLPGATLWHEGQFEGREVRLPVFLGRRPARARGRSTPRVLRELLPAAARRVRRRLASAGRDRLAGQRQPPQPAGLELDRRRHPPRGRSSTAPTARPRATCPCPGPTWPAAPAG